MDTIYAFVIIINGVLVPGDNAPMGFLSGTLENKITYYFESLQTCELAMQEIEASKGLLLPSEIDADVKVTQCEGIQVAE
jgi:hypothetical protein